ncbi:ABC-2 family transporter protein [Vallitalea pronyensis]|uniref:ABC-2 family transporter protein n=1 Tax=Vallitalea pronyensis TaxID=1348613 RepID=A0A8J8MIN8_9FIRM|nr:ABC-2 family transporter protein [Vallitalea pronyensis]QUI22547.1 ABC-2 family transporter protein [Vallitalea pronyensis]
MGNIIKNIKRYVDLYLVFAKNSLISQMEYRANFAAGILVEIGYFLAKFLYAIVVYQTGVTINGMAPDAILMFIGTYVMMTGIFMTFYTNFVLIPNYVRDGSLDLLMTKPVSLQFMATLRHLNYAMPIPNIIGGFVLIIIGWHKTGIPVTLAHILGFIGFTIIGILITYSVFLIPVLCSFWLISTSGLVRITETAWDFNNMPMDIYNKTIKNIGTFVIPIFLVSNFSPLFLLGRLETIHILWAIVAPFVFFTITRLIWKKAIKNYTSASS